MSQGPENESGLPQDGDRQQQTPPASQSRNDSGGSPTLRAATRNLYAVLIVCGFLLLAVWMVFGQSLHHDFVNYDDNEYVYENPHVMHGLTAEEIAWAFTSSSAANWHPLTWLSHMLDCQLYGLHAGGHHLTNVLLHAATAVLLFLVLRRMTGDLWPSAFVAALFAIHPLHVESVAWVAERKDVLSGLFFMLTLAAYLGYVRRPFSLVRYLLSWSLFALGLMAKPMLVTLPFVLAVVGLLAAGTDKAAIRGSRSPSATSRSRLCDRVLAGKDPLAGAGGRLLRGDDSGPKPPSSR